MKKALVTGAAGFVGSHLAETLVKRGYEVTCLVRGTSDLRWLESLDVRLLVRDLADIESRSQELRDFNYVFHIAGATKARSENDFLFANAECTKRLLKALSRERGRLDRFLYLSSLAAAGPSGNGGPLTEDSPPAPVSAYGRSKLEGEKSVLAMREQMPVTILRPSAVFGPRDKDFLVMFRLINRGVFPYWGLCRYSLLFIDDLVEGIVRAAESGRSLGETYFIDDGHIYENREIAGEISSALERRAYRLRLPASLLPLIASIGEKIDKKGIINADRMRDFRFSSWTCDSGKAREHLGFVARTSLQEGIKWTADWYRIHQWL